MPPEEPRDCCFASAQAAGSPPVVAPWPEAELAFMRSGSNPNGATLSKE